MITRPGRHLHPRLRAVSDLADAHVAAIAWMATGLTRTSFNLGNGRGFSVAKSSMQLRK
jgi:UDP-glucose 4-epimerase